MNIGLELWLMQTQQIVRITGGNDKQGFPMKQGVVWQTKQDLTT